MTTTWAEAKHWVMKDNYNKQAWFHTLDAKEKKLLVALHTAQTIKGDMSKIPNQTIKPNIEELETLLKKNYFNAYMTSYLVIGKFDEFESYVI